MLGGLRLLMIAYPSMSLLCIMVAILSVGHLKKTNVVVKSNSEAEYTATAFTDTELIWIPQLRLESKASITRNHPSSFFKIQVLRMCPVYRFFTINPSILKLIIILFESNLSLSRVLRKL